MALNEQNNCTVRLQAATDKIAFLKQALLDKEQELLNTDTGCLRESEERLIELEDSVVAWQDKYDRLYDSHKRVQKINQNLEDKLLKLVDRNETERAQLTSDVATMSVRLAQANYNIATLQREIERYKTDISLAINLLQCKPDSFVPQKVSSLPIDVQSKVSSYMLVDTNSHSDSEGSTSGVGIGFGTSGSYKALPASDSPPPSCSFSPASVVYSMRNSDVGKNSINSNLCKNSVSFDKSNSRSPISMRALNDIKCTVPSNSVVNNRNTNNNHNNNNISSNNDNNNNRNNNNKITNGLVSSRHDLISPSIMAKFLEDELKLSEVKHCSSCQCSSKDLTVLANVSHSYSVSTQTTIPLSGLKFSLSDPISTGLCLRCNSNLNSPSRTNSPSYRMKILRSNDSVISDTKSSDVSDVNDMDKLYMGSKRDDIMVNPILSHHRLCERTVNNNIAHGRRLSYAGNCQSNSSNDNGHDVNDDHRSKAELLNSMNMQLNNENKQNQQHEENCMNGIEDEEEDEVKPLLSDFSSTNEMNADEYKMKDDDLKDHSIPKVFDDNGDLTQGSSISGSVNSMWSKINNFEGVKMFENFNRNLIKTIKAENPKYQGPRLCAIRIQQTDNGSDNILLDNTESVGVTQPIIYTKRERFVDEELDDDGEVIITSSKNEIRSVDPLENPSQMRESDQNPNEDPLMIKTEDESENLNIPKVQLKSTDIDNNENCILDTRIPPSPNSPSQNTDAQVISKHETHCSHPLDYIIKEMKEEEDEEEKKEMINHNLAEGYHDQNITKPLGGVGQMIQSDTICRNSQKSYTSTAISEANDLPENEQFRRQQLNRVAEWIQNNSKQQQQDKRRQTLADGTQCALRPTKSTALEYLNSKQSSSPQLCNITSTPHEDQNVKVSRDTMVNHKCSWVISSGSDPPIIYNTTNTLGGSSNEKLPVFDVCNYKYYPWGTDRSLAIEAKLHTTTHHVDIAQMEYNVKQFLLKQNEWSIRNSNRFPTEATTTTNKQSKSLESKTNISTTIIAYETRAKRNAGTINQQQPQQKYLRSPRTLRQSKIFKVPRGGPGMGERITPTGVTKASGMEICKIESQQQDQLKQSQTYAQRTETNL